ncbi:MAG: hypothetical protein L0Y35_02090 [Flammeovirgaceae bacterium]|nr:hypothetical protein [Flammeovirgaceae bacterium]
MRGFLFLLGSVGVLIVLLILDSPTLSGYNKKERELIMLQASPNNVLQLAPLEDALSRGRGQTELSVSRKEEMGEAKQFIKKSYLLNKSKPDKEE